MHKWVLLCVRPHIHAQKLTRTHARTHAHAHARAHAHTHSYTHKQTCCHVAAGAKQAASEAAPHPGPPPFVAPEQADPNVPETSVYFEHGKKHVVHDGGCGLHSNDTGCTSTVAHSHARPWARHCLVSLGQYVP